MTIKCNCGWIGDLQECKIAMYLKPFNPRPVNQGGDGTRWRCPKCNTLLKSEYKDTNIKTEIR